FKCIGRGACGRVWTLVGTSVVYKSEENNAGRSVQDEFRVHMQVQSRILDSLDKVSRMPIRITSCYGIIETHDPWWKENQKRFPEYEITHPCRLIKTERIPPMPSEVRETLIEHYCPETLKSAVRANPQDQDCITRLYLGRRRKPSTRKLTLMPFTLRNYLLHVDRMEEMRLDIMGYSLALADALAQLHWCAEIDANGVEFVLVLMADYPQCSATSFKSELLGPHNIWLLDYESCKPLAMEEDGLDQAVDAFYRNDPYYPRP
ncbi:hypothetical protein CC78DRAFT_425526, partial [Lojkania enalia]